MSSQGRPSPMISSAKPYSMPCRPLGNPAFRSVFPTPGVYAAFPVRLPWIASSFPALWRAFPLGMLGHGSRTGGRSQQGQLVVPSTSVSSDHGLTPLTSRLGYLWQFWSIHAFHVHCLSTDHLYTRPGSRSWGRDKPSSSLPQGGSGSYCTGGATG